MRAKETENVSNCACVRGIWTMHINVEFLDDFCTLVYFYRRFFILLFQKLDLSKQTRCHCIPLHQCNKMHILMCHNFNYIGQYRGHWSSAFSGRTIQMNINFIHTETHLVMSIALKEGIFNQNFEQTRDAICVDIGIGHIYLLLIYIYIIVRFIFF